MTLRSARTAPAVSPLGTRIVLLAGLLLLGAALAQVAQAANDLADDCDRLESSLRSLDVPVTELPTDTETRVTAAAPTLPGTGPAPVLRLTPRVATIMREVFDALPIVMLDENGEEIDARPQPTAESIETAPSGSPVVNAPLLSDEDVPDAPLPKSRSEALDGRLFLPRFQQQMYRTDI